MIILPVAVLKETKDIEELKRGFPDMEIKKTNTKLENLRDHLEEFSQESI